MPPISMQVVTPPRSSSAIEKSTQARPAASSCASLRTGSISNRPEYQNCGLPRSSMNERSSGEPAMWAWVVMRPGVSTRSRASIVSSAAPSSVRPTWTMRSPSTTTTPWRSRRWPRPSKATIQPALIAVRRAITSLRDDGRVEPHDDVAADGAGAEARRKEPHRTVDPAVLHGVVDGQRDRGGGRVADALDVEIELLGRETRRLGIVDDHRLVRLVRHDEVDGLQQAAAAAVGIRQRGQLADHLREVALHERLHLGTVHGDVVVEVRIRPDDRVHLAHGAAGVGLEVFYVGRGH